MRAPMFEIVEVDYEALTDEGIAALNAFERVMLAEEHPDDPPRPLALTDAEIRNIPDLIQVREFRALDPDGSMAALAYAYWQDREENRHVARVVLQVRPDRRRQGLARVLLAR